MTEFTDALASARRELVRDEYADRVKRLVMEQLKVLEPEAAIEDTGYFNHSAIPDFVATWNNAPRREIFVRSSYADIVASNDVDLRQNDSALFMAIDPGQTVVESGFEMRPQDLRLSVRSANRILLTDAFAVAEIATTTDTLNPLGSAVRANFLRGGRGLIDEPVADSLLGGMTNPGEGVSELIRQVFLEDAVFRMERTAALVDWALSPNSEITALQSAVLNGTMSVDELRNVLPWLLRQTATSGTSQFWERLGGMFSFESLEAVATELEGIDLTSLVRSNLTTWSAKRAYLGLNIVDDPDSPQPVWAFIGGVLRMLDDERVVRVSYSGHKLRPRPGGISPRWNDVRRRVRDYKLRSVSLSGVERSLQIEARSSEDINDDVQAVAASVEDDYFVDSVRLMTTTLAADELTPVDVNFSESMATAERAVQLGALVAVALNVIGSERSVEEPHAEGNPVD